MIPETHWRCRAASTRDWMPDKPPRFVGANEYESGILYQTSNGLLGNNSLGWVLPQCLAAQPRGAPVLDGWRGRFPRADSIENASSGVLDVLQALRQQLGITVVELDVVLRR